MALFFSFRVHQPFVAYSPPEVQSLLCNITIGCYGNDYVVTNRGLELGWRITAGAGELLIKIDSGVM